MAGLVGHENIPGICKGCHLAADDRVERQGAGESGQAATEVLDFEGESTGEAAVPACAYQVGMAKDERSAIHQYRRRQRATCVIITGQLGAITFVVERQAGIGQCSDDCIDLNGASRIHERKPYIAHALGSAVAAAWVGAIARREGVVDAHGRTVNHDGRRARTLIIFRHDVA